jgi:hypothetical protein
MSIEKHSRKAALRGTTFLAWLFCAAFLSGCARHYDMTLTNGMRITNVTKPKLYREEGAYYYKDVAGNVHHVSSGRVVEIKPHDGKKSTP